LIKTSLTQGGHKMEELLEMSQKEINRYHILQKVNEKQLSQKQAATFLNIGERQVRNLLVRLEREGPKGLISKHRGKRGNHRKPDKLKRSVLALISEQYEGFGPTLAKEKLEEWHKIKLSTETLRLWMIEHNLWTTRKKRKKIHSTRQRRECFGELIQADGSHHHWFGDENPPANATVFIDDATSTLTALVFSQGETLDSYFQALEQHLKQYGRPRALYTDRYSVFQSNNKEGLTHMQQALKKLEIEQILANSPQAKGRVERANRILQDRLLKEFKIRGIKTIEDANAFAREFIKTYNKKFSKKPMNDFDAHRSLDGYDLERVLCRLEERTLSSTLTFQFNKNIYQVQGISEFRRLKGRKVEVRQLKEERIRVFLDDKELKVVPLNQLTKTIPVLSRKELFYWKPRGYHPSPEHPWKRYSYHQTLKKKTSERNRNL
jgi:transposase